jgi:hypothetical protein
MRLVVRTDFSHRHRGLGVAFLAYKAEDIRELFRAEEKPPPPRPFWNHEAIGSEK